MCNNKQHMYYIARVFFFFVCVCVCVCVGGGGNICMFKAFFPMMYCDMLKWFYFIPYNIPNDRTPIN